MVELVQYRLVLCGTGSFSIGHGQYWLVLFGTGLFSIGQYGLILFGTGLFSTGQYWLVLFGISKDYILEQHNLCSCIIVISFGHGYFWG